MDIKTLTIKNTKKYWYIILLIVIFLSAFWIRSFPARFNELQAIDPFYMYRISEYIVENNFQVPANDLLRHHPFGVPPLSQVPIPFYLPAAAYLIAGPLTGLDYFHFALLYPAIMGALAVVAMFFLGNEMFDRKAGLLAAFFLATVPAFITRTSAGFFDKEASAGVISLVTLYFLVRAYKRGSWKSGIISGVSMMILTQTWSGIADYTLLFVSLFALIALLLNKDIERLAKAFVPFIFLGTIPVQLFPYHPYLFSMYNVMALSVLGILLVRLAVERFNFIKKDQMMYVVPGIIVIGVVGLMGASMFTDFGTNIVDNVLYLATLQRDVTFSTVAEANPGDWNVITGSTSVLYGKSLIPYIDTIAIFLSLNLFMLFGAVLLLYRFYKKWDFIALLLFIWLASSIWAVFGFIRLLFLLGPPVALASAFAVSKLIDVARERKVMKEADTPRKTINYISVPLIIFVSLVVVANFANGYVYGISLGPSMNEYWQDAMQYLATETPENSNILSWWDFGYWFQTRGERPTLTDGGFGKRDEVAWWFTADYTNWTEFDPWLKDKYGIDYILMDYTLPGKYGAISKIASNGEQIVGMMQFQQSQVYPQDNKTIFEFVSGPYALWLPMDGAGSELVDSPMLLVSQNGQYSSPVHINNICSTAGISTVGIKEPSIGGCVAITSMGIFYVPEEAYRTIFSNLMFMEGADLPVEKVFDNALIKIFRVVY